MAKGGFFLALGEPCKLKIVEAEVIDCDVWSQITQQCITAHYHFNDYCRPYFNFLVYPVYIGEPEESLYLFYLN